MYLLPAGATPRSNRKVSAVSLQPMPRRPRGLGQADSTVLPVASPAPSISLPSSIDIPGFSISTATPLLIGGGLLLLAIYALGATREKRVTKRRARYSSLPGYLAQVGI